MPLLLPFVQLLLLLLLRRLMLLPLLLLLLLLDMQRLNFLLLHCTSI